MIAVVAIFIADDAEARFMVDVFAVGKRVGHRANARGIGDEDRSIASQGIVVLDQIIVFCIEISPGTDLLSKLRYERLDDFPAWDSGRPNLSVLREVLTRKVCGMRG